MTGIITEAPELIRLMDKLLNRAYEELPEGTELTNIDDKVATCFFLYGMQNGVAAAYDVLAGEAATSAVRKVVRRMEELIERQGDGEAEL